MLYRIRFEPRGAFWVVEISVFMGLIWSRVQDENGVMSFHTFWEARDFCVARGLDHVYRDSSKEPLSGFAG